MIENIKIDGLFGSKNINWNLQKTNVLVGKNGTGKSTILELIRATLDPNILTSANFKRIAITDSQKQVFFSLPQLFSIKQNNQNKELLNSNIENLSFLQFLSLVLQIIETTPEIKPSIELQNTYREPITTIEFIKTQNIFENSKSSDSIDGKQYALIDFLMQKELERISDKENLKALENTLNVFFNETDSIIEIENNNIIVKKDNKEISLNQLSSGEKQVIYIMIKAMIAKETGALLLMDEPEISLHLSWQKKLLTEIRKINDVSQIIVVTHSPAIVVGKWFDSFIDIKDITTEININTEVGNNS